MTWMRDLAQVGCVAVCCSVLQCVAVCCSEIAISESMRDLGQVGSEPWNLEEMRSESWIRDLDQK